MIDSDELLCTRCEHCKQRPAAFARRRFAALGLAPVKVEYGCAAVNMGPVRPHLLPEGFDGDPRSVCPSFSETDVR